jgi:hypothetical protein
MNKALKIFTSLRLTVVCLCFSIALVFIGTLAQVDEGTYIAQTRYFRSLLIWWSPNEHVHIPVFPGGYLIGGVLLMNLIAAHITRFKFSKSKIGILITHLGLIILLLGQFATDLLSRETHMRLTEGEAKNYSEAFRDFELALVDPSDANSDRVYAIADSLLAQQRSIESPKLPVTIRVKNYWPNADLFRTPAIASNIPPNTVLPKELAVSEGSLKGICVLPLPIVTDTEALRQNLPAALVEFNNGGKSLGTYLFYAGMDEAQELQANGKTYEITLRHEREYYPFTLTLLKATHEKYKGTEVPKNFASRIRLDNPEKHEARETMIYMNNPLRYEGMTFFQFQMDADQMAMQAGKTPSSTFQVVRNPSWITPYLACVMVAVGLVVQFLTHLVGFATKRRAASTAKATTKTPRHEGSEAQKAEAVSTA